MGKMFRCEDGTMFSIQDVLTVKLDERARVCGGAIPQKETIFVDEAALKKILKEYVKRINQSFLHRLLPFLPTKTVSKCLEEFHVGGYMYLGEPGFPMYVALEEFRCWYVKLRGKRVGHSITEADYVRLMKETTR